MVLPEVTIGPVGTQDGESQNADLMVKLMTLTEEDLAPVQGLHSIRRAVSHSVFEEVASMVAVRVDDASITMAGWFRAIRLERIWFSGRDQTASPARMAYRVICFSNCA